MKKLKKNILLTDSILEQLMLGTPLTGICKAASMPSLTTVYKWMRQDQKFNDKIIEARKTGAFTLLDQGLELLSKEEIAPNQVAYLKEKMHHFRWTASKLISVYGDKQEVKQTGDTSLTIKWEVPNLPSSEHAHASTIAGDGVQKEQAATIED